MKTIVKCLALIVIAAAIVGCDKAAVDVTYNYGLPEGLSDCKIYDLTSGKGDLLKVVRCPNSSTSTNYRSGKTSRSVTVLD